MDLKDYSTEELRAELRRRNDLAKDEKAEVKDAECASTVVRYKITPSMETYLD